MNREEKAAVIEEFNDKFARAKIAIVADYQGLTVPVFQQLRRNLKNNNTEIKVVKNTLLRQAAKDTAYESLQDFFAGTTVIAISFKDPVAPAKVITEFAKENDKLQIKGAALDGKILTLSDLMELAKLPSREVMLSQVLAVMQAVPTSFVRVLNGVPQKFVYLLQALKDIKEKEQEH